MLHLKESNTRSVIYKTIIGLLVLLVGPTLQCQYGMPEDDDTLNKSVFIHPVIDGELVTSEHEYREQLRLGDQLGRDFSIIEITDDGIVRRFETDGKTNEDWYGWRADVLAPMDGEVTRVQAPDTVNTPGVMNRDADPGLIFFENNNGVTVIYAHVREITVKEGDRVEAGEVVAKVGNNGNSRNPHVHVGAWKGDTPLQIQVDLYAEHRGDNSSQHNQE